jgi:uncharacterized membrane protein YhaH (DUF805 family)
MHWYFKAIQNFAIFHTRARRKEFFNFLIFHMLFLLTAILLDIFLLGHFPGGSLMSLTSIYLIATIIPCFSVAVRRLHDTGRPGGYLFFILVPVIGAIYLLWIMSEDSDVYVNEWGVCPKRIRQKQI